MPLKKNTKEILDTLSSGPVQKFVLEHQNSDIREMVLKNKVLFSIPVERLSDQIASRRKAKEKLPLYYDAAGIVYPPPENFEQSSSEVTARYKSELTAQLIPRRVTGADLTGGFGVDTFFLSEKFEAFHHIEPDGPLQEIAAHNHKLLGAGNIEYHRSTAEAFVESWDQPLDFVYLDPSRRAVSGKRVKGFGDSHPDVLTLKEKILVKAPYLLVKASPLLDLQAGINQLGNARNVFVVSVHNECKEVLFFCEHNFDGVAAIEAVNIHGDATDQFRFTLPEERDQEVTFGDPLLYLYEPNASILKAGAFKTVAARFGLSKLSVNTHLYTAPHLVGDFPGRIFEIEALVKADAKTVKPFFPEGKGNVTTRNYPLSAEALKKKVGLNDGGEKYLIGFSGQQKKFVAIARREI